VSGFRCQEEKVSGVGCQVSGRKGVRCRVAGVRIVKVSGVGNSEVGMRPPASPSCRLSEPEAIGAHAYAPAGMRKIRKGAGRKHAI
jgi:hypothetical protein